MSGTAGVIAPPPLIFLSGLALGVMLDWATGLTPLPIAAPYAIGFAVVLGLAGALLIAAALRLFARAGTPPEPWKPTAALATDGVYRITRNPMYLGMALLLLAFAIGLRSSGTLLLWPLIILVVDRFVIAREERYLDSLFGQPYVVYRARVRRWV
jgi:protein-S-isoprenylcysteine O-methyltransferase Ste14